MLLGKIKKSLSVLHKNDGRTDAEIKKKNWKKKGRRVRMLEISLQKKKKKGCWRFRDELRKV